ncbi:MAG: hypothetical protein ONB05_12280, partial [candidate division KSB1 bacterium]|nr:hypothetical protein [candidate division KSB1 bacterium]
MITAISVTPLDAESQVNGDFKPLILKPVMKSSGYYVLKENFQVLGKIGLGVSCYDQANQADNELGIHVTRLYLDDSLRFTARYDHFSYEQSEQVELDRDYRLNRRGYGIFHKLYRDEASTLDFYWPQDAEAGIINTRAERGNFLPLYDFMIAEDSLTGQGFLSEGLHYFQIEVTDFYENISTVSGQFIVGNWPTIEPKIVVDDLGYFYLAGVEELGGKALTNINAYLSRDKGNTWTKVLPSPQSGLFSQEATGNEEPFTMKFLTSIPNSAEGTYILKIVAEDERGLLSLPAYRILKNQNPFGNRGAWIEIDKDFYDDYFRIELHATEVLLEKPQVII